MRSTSRWHRLRDVVLSSDPRRRVLTGMSLLALALMVAGSLVMLLVARTTNTVNATAVQWWAAISVGGLGTMTALIRAGATARLADPSLTIPQMGWTITSGAVAYVLAGEARGLIPSVLAMILFFGTFGLNVAQVVRLGCYALFAFACAIGVTTHLHNRPLNHLDTAYALMVLIVLSGCIVLTLRIQRIRSRLAQQRQALAEALAVNRELATRDELTGLYNRRARMELMQLEHRRCQRSGRPMVLAQLDIDHFKPINDRHGHATGDRALQAFAAAVRASVRDADVLARWGGEEFVLMLTDTRPEDARELLDRIRRAVESLQIAHASGTLRLTVSIGVATHLPQDTVERTLERADQALYTAKALGRNRVAVAAPAQPGKAGAGRGGAREADIEPGAQQPRR